MYVRLVVLSFRALFRGIKRFQERSLTESEKEQKRAGEALARFLAIGIASFIGFGIFLLVASHPEPPTPKRTIPANPDESHNVQVLEPTTERRGLVSQILGSVENYKANVPCNKRFVQEQSEISEILEPSVIYDKVLTDLGSEERLLVIFDLPETLSTCDAYQIVLSLGLFTHTSGQWVLESKAPLFTISSDLGRPPSVTPMRFGAHTLGVSFMNSDLVNGVLTETTTLAVTRDGTFNRALTQTTKYYNPQDDTRHWRSSESEASLQFHQTVHDGIFDLTIIERLDTSQRVGLSKQECTFLATKYVCGEKLQVPISMPSRASTSSSTPR